MDHSDNEVCGVLVCGLALRIAFDQVRNLIGPVKCPPNAIARSGAIPCAFISYLAIERFPSFDHLQAIDQGKHSARVHRDIGPADNLEHTQGVRHFLVPPLVAAHDGNS